jgi:non-ribosomal peptide synthetase component F
VHRALAGDAGGAARHPQGRGAYLPLDPDYPPERLAFMLADAGAPVLLTRTALRAHLPAHDDRSDAYAGDARIVCLDADWPAIARQPTTAPVTGLAPQHHAYVIYTSGSTGTPKGVRCHSPQCGESS